MTEPLDYCPSCGALPCDWVNNPHTEAHLNRVSELIRYNSEQVVLRRSYKAQLDIAHIALRNAETILTDYLQDNTDKVFEEIPEIDALRSQIQDALQNI